MINPPAFVKTTAWRFPNMLQSNGATLLGGCAAAHSLTVGALFGDDHEGWCGETDVPSTKDVMGALIVSMGERGRSQIRIR